MRGVAQRGLAIAAAAASVGELVGERLVGVDAAERDEPGGAPSDDVAREVDRCCGRGEVDELACHGART